MTAKGQEIGPPVGCPTGNCPSGNCPTGECEYGVCTPGCGCECPVQGPRDEYLCDGGDHELPAAVTRDRTVDGLEQEDTIAHYDTPYDQTFVTPSNKVCIYAPRFAVVRQVIDLRESKRYEMVMGSIRQSNPGAVSDPEWAGVKLASLEPTIDRAKQPPSLLRERQQPGELDRDQRVAVVLASIAPAVDVQVVWTGEILGRDVVKIARASLAAITWTGVQAPQVLIDNRQAIAEVSVQSPGTIYHLKYPSDPRLRLIKLASKSDALPGEEVEFTLRYDNVGNQTLVRIAIVDNLTTRLEYVDGSQKSSDPAAFSTSSNPAESLILRWELKEPLKPGEGGVLVFRTRVK